MTRVLVFVDESGTPNMCEPLFSVAAAWCIPRTREGAQTTLRYTIDRLRDLVNDRHGTYPRELKYSACPDMVDELVERFCSVSQQDNSIHADDLPWHGKSVGFTFSLVMCKAEAATRGLGRADSLRSDFGNLVRTRALVEVLRPLITYDGPGMIEASVIADDAVWKEAASRLGWRLERVVNTIGVRGSVHCDKSTRTPGLQLADLAAGLQRRFLRTGQNQTAFQELADRTVYHLCRTDTSTR